MEENKMSPTRLRFEVTYHSEITSKANEGLLDDQQLARVILANMAQDLLQTQSCVHFDNCDFNGSLKHIDAEWNVINTVGDEYPEAALYAFGALLHTTQDFYAHSNWIELHIDQWPIEVWDQKLNSLPSSIVSGTWPLGVPKLCGSNAPTHEELNKDSPTSKEGSKIVPSGLNQGKTLFELAFDTAVAASKLQFSRFSSIKLTSTALTFETGGATLEGFIRTNARLRKAVYEPHVREKLGK